MANVDELRAQLDLAELEAQLVASKGDRGDEYDYLKARVRAARQEYRETYRTSEGAAEPETVELSATVGDS
jgi:hypothetical protein